MKAPAWCFVTIALARVCSDLDVDYYNFRRASGPPENQHPPACTPPRKSFLQTEGIGSRVRAQGHNDHNSTHLVHLSVFQSFESWCQHPCMSATWEIAAPKPRSDAYKLYEAVIWRQEDPPRLAVYQFDDVFERKANNTWQLCGGQWSCISFMALRESYNVLNVPLNPDPDHLSYSLRCGFEKIFALLAHDNGQVHADAAPVYIMSYSGHGGTGDGSLFEGFLRRKDAVDLLHATQRVLQWSVLNVGTNCEEGRWGLLDSLHPFFRYIIASDLKVGGWDNDGRLSTEDKEALVMGHTKLSAMVTIRRGAELRDDTMALCSRILHNRRRLWRSLTCVAAQQHRQSVSVYETRHVVPFRDTLRQDYATHVAHAPTKRAFFFQAVDKSKCDVWTAADVLGNPAAKTQFTALRVLYASTQDIFRWSEPISHGLKFNYVVEWGEGPPCATGHFFGDADRIKEEQKYLTRGMHSSMLHPYSLHIFSRTDAETHKK